MKLKALRIALTNLSLPELEALAKLLYSEDPQTAVLFTTCILHEDYSTKKVKL